MQTQTQDTQTGFVGTLIIRVGSINLHFEKKPRQLVLYSRNVLTDVVLERVRLDGVGISVAFSCEIQATRLR